MSRNDTPELIDMPDEQYFTDKPEDNGRWSIDQTPLKNLMVSPRCYAWNRIHPFTPTLSMNFGTFCHSLVLGSGGKYEVKPNTRTKAGKEEAAKLEAQGYKLVSEADMEKARIMAGQSASYFDVLGGTPELAMFADDPRTGLRLKGKADWLPKEPDDDGVYRIRDYKTTSIDLNDFPKHAADMGYHIQAAFYIRLLTEIMGAHVSGDYITDFDLEQVPIDFEFVVQETKPPYDFAVWQFRHDDYELELANRHIDQALQHLKAWLHTGEGYQDRMLLEGIDKDPRHIDFPNWSVEKEERQLEKES